MFLNGECCVCVCMCAFVCACACAREVMCVSHLYVCVHREEHGSFMCESYACLIHCVCVCVCVCVFVCDSTACDSFTLDSFTCVTDPYG